MFELPFTDPFFQPWCKRLMVQASFCLLRVCGDSAILSISGKAWSSTFGFAPVRRVRSTAQRTLIRNPKVEQHPKVPKA